MRPLLGLRWSLVLSVVAGIALWLSFAPLGVAIFAVLGVAALTAACWRSGVARAALCGLLSGGVFFGLLLSWMQVIGSDAWVALAVYCAGWLALVGGATALVTRLPAAPVWTGCLWVLEEALRGRVPWGGFPWGDLAFSQADSNALRFAALGGSTFVSFAVAVAGAAIVAAAVDWHAARRAVALLWVAVVLALTAGPLLISVPADGDNIGGPESAVVAITQGGTPQTGMGALDVRRAVLDNHVAQTLDLAKSVAAGVVERPDFVLWPENSSDIDPFADPSAAEAIGAAARAIDAPIVVGAIVRASGPNNGLWNMGVVWDPRLGPQQSYIKRHPVPFGEYVPFRDFLTAHIGRFDRVPLDFLPGGEPGNLTVAGIPIGDVICFEIAYDDVVGDVVLNGARLLTVQTNNATYSGTAQPDQQLAIERVRATEFGRSVIVAATSGISAVISPDSSVSASRAQGESGWLVERVPLRGGATLGSRIGGWVELAICAIGIAAVIVAMVHTRRVRRRPIA